MLRAGMINGGTTVSECVRMDNDTIMRGIRKIESAIDTLADEQLYRPLGEKGEDAEFYSAVNHLCYARCALMKFRQKFVANWFGADCEIEPFSMKNPDEYFWRILKTKRENIRNQMCAENAQYTEE